MNIKMTFGDAIEALKDNKCIARESWKTKTVFIYLNRGSSAKLDTTYIDDINSRLYNLGDIGTTTRLPNLNSRNDNGNTITGWSPTQVDMLAEDWFIVGEDY